mmetsp:Transcript_1415/g.2231  ORF Transcript_1415/g.2231 Transcript_1415/m.2231 type:complete len:253 (-) Transcript_1415:195-953(-)
MIIMMISHCPQQGSKIKIIIIREPPFRCRLRKGHPNDTPTKRMQGHAVIRISRNSVPNSTRNHTVRNVNDEMFLPTQMMMMMMMFHPFRRHHRHHPVRKRKVNHLFCGRNTKGGGNENNTESTIVVGMDQKDDIIKKKLQAAAVAVPAVMMMMMMMIPSHSLLLPPPRKAAVRLIPKNNENDQDTVIIIIVVRCRLLRDVTKTPNENIRNEKHTIIIMTRKGLLPQPPCGKKTLSQVLLLVGMAASPMIMIH